jgi:hypothetical protein
MFSKNTMFDARDGIRRMRRMDRLTTWDGHSLHVLAIREGGNATAWSRRKTLTTKKNEIHETIKQANKYSIVSLNIAISTEVNEQAKPHGG